MNTLKEIVLKAINEAGADGLVNVDAECGCSKDDLWPCGSPYDDCELAKLRKTTDEERAEMEMDCSEWFVPLSRQTG